MSKVKDRLREIINALPEDATLEDANRKLYEAAIADGAKLVPYDEINTSFVTRGTIRIEEK